MALDFDWDDDKAESNLAKHGVSFVEATTVFEDPLSLDILDPDHSEDEMRYIKIGRSYNHRLLVIVYTERGVRERIISAREATRNERRNYEEGI